MLYNTSPSTPVFGLRREIDRLFEDAFGRGNGVTTWSPAVDVRETDQEVRLDVEIPGINPDDIEMTVDNGVLSVRGEKRTERKEGEENSRYHLVERSYGSFMRSFQLPQGLDESKIQADYNNGILSVHIPKTALPQPRKIEIGMRQNQQQRRMMAGGDLADRPTTGQNRTGTTSKGTTGTADTSTKNSGTRNRESTTTAR